MNWIALLLLTILQALTGLGIISLFKIKLKPAMQMALWMMTGAAIFSLIPFLLQLLYIPITAVNVFVALFITTLLANIKYKQSREAFKQVIAKRSFRIQLYEIPTLLVITAIMLISVWRCFYWPPTSRDITSGAEVIAEYAIKEKTMINSVFSVNLETTNNQFKPPFATSLQIIYKYAGFPFGQLWLSTIFISFMVFLYHALAQTLHRTIAGVLLLLFLIIPEMYAYTFMILFDYSNAVFFFLATWFLFQHFRHYDKHNIRLAGVLMGLATYIRSETLVLAAFLAIIILWQYGVRKKQWLSMILAGAWFLIPSVLLYALSITIYINYYLPALYKVEALLNPDLFNLGAMAKRFITVNKELIFSEQGITYYGYFIFFFLPIVITDLVWKEKLSPPARQWLFAVLVIYLGLPLLGHILPLIDIDNSTKRGFFKLFPLMLLYMGNSNFLQSISQKIEHWENGGKEISSSP